METLSLLICQCWIVQIAYIPSFPQEVWDLHEHPSHAGECGLLEAVLLGCTWARYFSSVIKDIHLSCTAVGLLAGVKSWLLLLLSHNFCTCKQVVIYLFFSLLDGMFHKLMICVHSFFSCSLHIELKFRNITSDGSTIIEGSSPLMSKFFVRTPTCWRKGRQRVTLFNPILTNQLGSL